MTCGEEQSATYFARHGQTEANVEGWLAGSSEAALTERGRQQATDLAQTLRESSIGIRTIISSPLGRAVETAAMVAGQLGLNPEDIISIPDLSERNGGDFEGKPLAKFYSAEDWEVAAYGGESLDMFAVRALKACRGVYSIASRNEGGTLVVAHAELKRMIDTLRIGLPPHAMPAMPKPNNAEIYPFPVLPDEYTINPCYKVRKGKVIDQRNDWLVVELMGSDGSACEIIEMPADDASRQIIGFDVAVAVDSRGYAECNKFSLAA